MSKAKGRSNNSRKILVRFVRTMLDQMVPKKKKVKMHSSVSTPKNVTLISPGIGGSYFLSLHSKSPISVTPKKIPPQKS